MDQRQILIQQAMGRAIAQQRYQSHRGLPTLRAIAASVPLIATFDVCFQIANSFRGCACGASAEDRAALFSGIFAQAMVPFAIGLLIAIPATVAHRCFHEQSRLLEVEMQNTASEFLNWTCTKS